MRGDSWLHESGYKVRVLSLTPGNHPFENLLSSEEIGFLDPATWQEILSPCLTGVLSKDYDIILNQLRLLNPEILFFNTIGYLDPEPLSRLRQRWKGNIIARSGGNDLAGGWLGVLPCRVHELSIRDRQNRIAIAVNTCVNRLIVNSQYSFAVALSIGISRKRLLLARGGVDVNRFRRSSLSTRVILGVGRFVPFKGYDIAIRAFAHSRAVEHGWTLKLVGFGPEESRLRVLSKEVGIESYVGFEGGLPFSKMHDLFESASLFLHLPRLWRRQERSEEWTHTETMGRSVCEALASGLPVVISDVGGLAEIVNGCGYVVPQEDVKAAAEGISLLTRDPGLRKLLGSAARHHAEECLRWEMLFPLYFG